MSIDLSPAITNSNTFAQWVSKTNSLITFADSAVTLDANNVGNVTLGGNFSLLNSGNVLTTNNISPVTGGKLSVAGSLETSDTMILNKGSGEAKLQFQLSGANKWAIETTSSQTALVLGDGTNSITLAASGITATGKIANAMLPTNVSLAGTLATTGLATFPTVDINGGNIDGCTIAASTGAFTSVNIGGGNIDGTAIGNSVRSTGKFTTISANGNATIGGSLGVTGTITGNVTGTASITNSLNATAVTQVLNAVYPVGSLYYTTVNSSPSSLGLPGTWTRFAEGRSVVGFDSGLSLTSASASTGVTTLNLSVADHGFSVGDTVVLSGFDFGGGNYPVIEASSSQIKVQRISTNTGGGSSRRVALQSATTVPGNIGSNHITQTIAQMPNHQHDTNIRTEGTSIFFGGQSYNAPSSGDCLDHLNKHTSNSTRTSNTGSGEAMDILNRSAVVYIWERQP
tara:strand:- start:4556 stop:5926 length:1371 start_codon:yes stop_codon:yes gene_type:complete